MQGAEPQMEQIFGLTSLRLIAPPEPIIGSNGLFTFIYCLIAGQVSKTENTQGSVEPTPLER
jgi:hypothetical protein